MKLLPQKVKSALRKYFEKEFRQRRAAIAKKMPVYKLDNAHIGNLRAVPNRLELLNLMPKNGVVVELGVDKGDFSQQILSMNNPRKLHLVDAWESERYSEAKRNSVVQRYSNFILDGIVQIDVGYSTGVGKKYPDEYFDWVYIDTDHSYETTRDELLIYSKKVKKGGIIAGHDFIANSKGSLAKYGVVEAVYEFCYKNNWEIIYLTMEMDDNPSFAIKEI